MSKMQISYMFTEGKAKKSIILCVVESEQPACLLLIKYSRILEWKPTVILPWSNDGRLYKFHRIPPAGHYKTLSKN